MLNDIRLHLDSDETQQSQLEHECANEIAAKQRNNAKAFLQFIPSIGNALSKIPFQRLSVFVDKNKNINIVDFNSGITLYGPDVDANIQAQVQSWMHSSALLSMHKPVQLGKTSQQTTSFSGMQEYAKQLQADCKAAPIDTLVILGLGKATHLAMLLDHTVNANLPTSNLKHIVIYEADWEIFRCSLSSFDWATFLAQAQQCAVQLFLQIGTPIDQLYTDISELNQQLSAKQILFFQHLNQPVYANIMRNLRAGIWGKAVTEARDDSLENNNAHKHHHLQPFSAINTTIWQQASSDNKRFKQNMLLFKEYFPDIHAAFDDYKPAHWDVLSNQSSSNINLFNTRNGAYFSNTQAAQEGQALAHHFSHYPNLDGLIFGYSGDKLKHYLHNSFIRQADMILRGNEQQQGELPNSVKALMVFGLGSGYMLESLFASHDIQNLIICEPNPDFFYASLYAIDWSPIFDKFAQGEHKLYINIGEASSRLFKDLMSQFLVLGPHLLNETFIMQGYQNPMLQQVLTEVRQQLKVIFAMGENFDHVAYGIAHTLSALTRKRPALRYEPKQYLSHQHQQTPIFFIGNGPSLDDSIDIIKEYRDQVIVVSCGTALQALYKNGITPDFHGEVEQNRANFDWASRIGDRAYLKQITLLSVNGIHPDTCQLYKNVLFAFKAGESSTHSILAMLPKNSFHMLNHAYPTVTNMAMSFFIAMGFEQLYLVGVDLGFADQNKHHSSASGYYENGKQLYDYKNVHATDLRVRGNRQDWVFTKTEFNISRMIIEQLLIEAKSAQNQHIECFNLSNGVFIEGSVSLAPEAVLVVASEQHKTDTLAAMNNCFMAIESDIVAMLKQSYNEDLLARQINDLHEITQVKLTHKVQIQSIIEQLRELIASARRTGKSLFFYYFFNSINYLSAALNKASLQSNDKLATKDCKQLLKTWQLFMQDAEHVIKHQLTIIDTAEAFSDRREKCLLALLPQQGKIDYFTFSEYLQHAIRQKVGASDSEWCHVLDNLQICHQRIVEHLTIHKAAQKADSVTRPLIIDINKASEADEIAKFIDATLKAFTAETSLPLEVKALNIGLLFHSMPMLNRFRALHPRITSDICLLYSSPSISATSKQANINQGTQDVLLDDDYLHALHSRAQDLCTYAFIFIKPRFSENGLKNAYQYKAQLLHESTTPKDVSATQALEHENDDNAGCGERVFVANNEYNCIALEHINKYVIEHFDFANYYMFKHYIGVIKDNQRDQVKPNITLLDSLENRGLWIPRKPFGFELLDTWYAPELLIRE